MSSSVCFGVTVILNLVLFLGTVIKYWFNIDVMAFKKSSENDLALLVLYASNGMMWLSLLTNGMSFSRSFLLIRLAFQKYHFFLSRFSTIEILLEEAAAIDGIIE